MRPNLSCKNPVEVAEKNGQRKLFIVLSRHLFEEDIVRKREKLEAAKAQDRAAEHRRKLELKMAANAEAAGSTPGEGNYKVTHLSLEESQSMAALAYDKAQRDAAEALRRKADEREKQAALLRALEEKHGKWKRTGRRRWKFDQQGGMTAEAEEGDRTLALADKLFEEITVGPREMALAERWRAKTGLSKRDPLPEIKVIPNAPPPPRAAKRTQAKLPTMITFKKSEWQSFPGAKP